MSKINKISLSLTTLLMLVSTSASAQWAVVDVAAIAQAVQNYYMMFSQGQAIGGVKGAVDALRATEAVGIKQAADLAKNEIFDRRKSMGDFEIVKRDLVVMPTPEKCIEVTSMEAFKGADSVQIATAQSRSKNKTGLKSKLAAVGGQTGMLSQTVLNRNASCSRDDVENGVTQCSSEGEYSDADRSSGSLSFNMKKSDVKIRHQAGKAIGGAPANYTIDETQQNEAQKYIINTISPRGPTINSNIAKINPQYVSIYNTIRGRLDTAFEGLTRILALSSRPQNLSATFKTFWNTEKPQYQELFPEFTWPENPSELEFINYLVRKNYVDALSDNKLSQEELLLKLNRQLALNNTIQMHNLSAINDLFKVNAMLLGHQITPLTVNDLENAAKSTRGITN